MHEILCFGEEDLPSSCFVNKIIPRLIEKSLLGKLKTFPVVVLLGPRQCGKTTLAKKLGHIYYDLEQDKERLKLDLDWDELQFKVLSSIR